MVKEVSQEVKYMCNGGIFKRIIPFALTFAAGLFLASFFVSVGLPGERWRNSRRANKFHEMQRLRLENDDLREKNRILRSQIDELQRSVDDADTEFVIPDAPPPVDFELDAHHPPPPPRKPKQPRHDFGTLQ